MATKLLVRTFAAFAICAGAGEHAWAKDCRPSDAPPGVRVPDRPGCKPPSVPGVKPAPGRGSQAGFVDLGNGTELRVSGRVRVETRSGR